MGYVNFNGHILAIGGQSAGGGLVSTVAYRGEYRTVVEELAVIDTVSRRKKCLTAPTWGSGTRSSGSSSPHPAARFGPGRARPWPMSRRRPRGHRLHGRERGRPEVGLLRAHLRAEVERLVAETMSFVEEEDVTITFLLDASPSMAFGRPQKLLFAKRAAAALGWSTSKRSWAIRRPYSKAGALPPTAMVFSTTAGVRLLGIQVDQPLDYRMVDRQGRGQFTVEEADFVRLRTGIVPFLLLDEIAAHLDPDRRREVRGRGDEGNLRAPAPRRRGERVPHTARGAVSQKAHRVDRLERGAGRDQDALAGHQLRLEGRHDFFEQLFGFEYHLEMYKPAAKRRWGYYALPILYGDRLVGKLDARADRNEGELRVAAIHRDVPFSKAMTAAVDREIKDLARWLDLELVLPD